MKIAFASLLFLGTAFAPSIARAADVPECASLNGMWVAPSVIGIPSNGARITAATMIPGSTRGAAVTAAYCLVSGEIAPIDPSSPDIEFQIALPTVWNGKALMLGGGGFDGVIPQLDGNLQIAPTNAPTPLARGYAVFGSDSGHKIKRDGSGPAIGRRDGAFLGNAESYRNYIGDALKKTRDVAMVVISRAYGRAPQRSYFAGGSKGGGEAMTVAGRWPADWDGIVALYPARNYTVAILGALATTQALAAPGAYLNLAKRGVLYRAALETCDALDGVKDGLISDVRRCNAIFNPATATYLGKPVRCPKGNETGDDCLSDAQIFAIRKAGGSTSFGFAVASGQKSFSGFNIKTSGLGNAAPSSYESEVPALTIGLTPAANPTVPGNSMAANFSDNFMRYAVARDPEYNSFSFDIAKPGELGQRLSALTSIDLGDADLSAYARRGGKLLILHGTDDMLVSPRETEAYYEALRARMGTRKVASFLRFYEVPGFGHGFSAVYGAAWDQLTALENWVEKGEDPAMNQTVIDTTGVPGRTRPLCRYPSWPKYNGSGDVNSAKSFACRTR